MRSIALLLSVASLSAMACDCVSLSFEERLRHSDVVFLGEVVVYEPLASVELRVLEVFKGLPGTRVLVPTGRSDCDYFVLPVRTQANERFLVFLRAAMGK
jgi:hypothetical protein